VIALVETWPRERPKGTKMGRGCFKLIADALKRSTPLARDGGAAMRQWTHTVYLMADALAVTNRSFRRETFLAACGVQP